jgi:hypothetical protein
MLFLDIVVIDLDATYDEAARCGDKVCDKECPQHVRLVEYAL